jgi:hypothetical protein
LVIKQLTSLNAQVDNSQQSIVETNVNIADMRLDERGQWQCSRVNEYISRKSSAVENFLNSASENIDDIPDQPLQSALHGLPQPVDHQLPYNADVPADLNHEQARVFREVVKWANDDAIFQRDPMHNVAPPPLRLLIASAAGTGKTHTVRRLFERLGSGVIATVSITGVASNFPKGATIHSTFAYLVTDRVHPSESAACSKFGSARILIIDEISTTQADAFVWVSRILCKWFARTNAANHSFVGLGVVAMGDFFQQPPVGRSLLQAYMLPGNAAGQLFSEFQRIKFTQQQRAIDDE